MVQNWNGFNPQIPEMIANQYGQPQQQGGMNGNMMPLILSMILKQRRQGQTMPPGLMGMGQGGGSPLGMIGANPLSVPGYGGQ